MRKSEKETATPYNTSEMSVLSHNSVGAESSQGSEGLQLPETSEATLNPHDQVQQGNEILSLVFV